jgi:hypothetical protein
MGEVKDELNPTSAGAEWAKWDVPTAKRFGGKWVVAVPNEVVEAGDDPAAVGERAAAKLGLDPKAVVVCAIAPLESWVLG